MKNLVLIGMPGCGKSTCGVLAAKALCMSFVDTDLLIQAAEGITLQAIINKKGNEYFGELEEKILLGVDEKNSVIATGGSAVYSEKAMLNFKKNGEIIYIKISYDEMIKRIENMETRGILLKEKETIEEMYSMREALYEKYADEIIEADNNNVEKTVKQICDFYSLL